MSCPAGFSFFSICVILSKIYQKRTIQMKAERSFPRMIITAKGARWVEQGHPGIYEWEGIRQ